MYTNTTSNISKTGAGQAVMSIMNFLANTGIIKYDAIVKKKARVLNDTELVSVRTAKSGFYESLVKAGDKVEAGTPLANIVNPYDGDVLETLYAPIDGVIFFIHNEPLTYANTAVIKILGDD